MTAIGFTWFFQGAGGVEQQRRLRDRRRSAPPLPYAILVHLLVTLPVRPAREPRPARRRRRSATSSTTVMQVGLGALRRPAEQDGCEGCPENPILIAGHEGVGEAISAVQGLIAIFADRRDRGDRLPPLAPQHARASAASSPPSSPPAASPSLSCSPSWSSARSASPTTVEDGRLRRRDRRLRLPPLRLPARPAALADRPRRGDHAPRSPPRTSSSTPSCGPRSRSCAPRGRGSSRPATRSGAGSSATSTTAPSSGWWR